MSDPDPDIANQFKANVQTVLTNAAKHSPACVTLLPVQSRSSHNKATRAQENKFACIYYATPRDHGPYGAARLPAKSPQNYHRSLCPLAEGIHIRFG